MSTDELDRMAEGVLEPVAHGSPELLRAFAQGLGLSDGPAALFAGPVWHLSVDAEHGGVPCRLTVLSMRHALRRASVEGSLIGTLSTAETAFWLGVGDALAGLAEERLVA